MAQSDTGADALINPCCVVDAAEDECSPRAEAALPSRPTALSLAEIGTLTLAIAPCWPVPTDVVEQLELALAMTPAEMEQALIGALTLATGLVWVVVLEPEALP
jgi:hypothetical protein